MNPDRSAAWRWGGLVVGLLGFQVALGVCAIVLATGDPSVAVVPNYYEKALRWDEKVLTEKSNQELAWNVVVEEIVRPNGRSGLTVRVTGMDGVPIDLAGASAKLYHHARASEVFERPLIENRETRVQTAMDCIDKPGWWQVELQLTDADGNQYLESRQIFFTCHAAAGNDS